MTLNVRLRGGSWFEASPVNASDLDFGRFDFGFNDVGFRCVQRVAHPLVGLRGGSWGIKPRYARASNRYYNDPANRCDFVGFRCCVRRGYGA